MYPVRRTARSVAGVIVTAAIIGLSMAQGSLTEQGKTAEEILNNLLGGERGVGGVRQEGHAGEQGRIALAIHFQYNSADISPESFDQLRQVADALKNPQLSTARIRIEGYTDDRGSAAYNLSLSRRRADAVKRYLVAREGIRAARLDATGYGESRPLPGVSQETDEGRAQNRRVEFVNLSGAAPAAAGRQEPAPVAGGALTVSVVVAYEKGGEKKILVPGGVLTPKDNYRIAFTPNQTSYVYVYQIGSKGKTRSVFPNTEYSPVGNPVKARQRYTVPPEGKWMTLDEVPGDEEIVVLASATELADPQGLAQRLRGESLAGAVRGPAADVRPDLAPELPAGVFSYRLPFKHR